MTATGEQASLDVHDYDMFGSRMAVCNDSFVVIARNDLQQFFISYDIFSTSSSASAQYCHLNYMNTDDYVQSVAASPINSSFFVYTGENLNRTLHFIGIINNSRSCASTYVNRHYFTAQSSLEGYDIYTLDIDPRGLFAYVIGWDSSWIYDLTTFQLKQFNSIHDIWQQVFKPYNLVILADNQHAVIIGYSFSVNWYYYMAISVIRLDPPNNITLISNQILLPNVKPIEADELIYSPMNDLVVSTNNQNQVLIGIPMYDVVLLGFVSTTLNVGVYMISNNISWIIGSMFGKSVVWLDNASFAVLAYSTVVPPWSSSQVLVFEIEANFLSSLKPVFTYPNNQQILGLSLRSPKFSRLSSSGSGNLAILLTNGHVQLLCEAPPGMYMTSFQLISNNTMVPFYGCQLSSCLAGTFKRLPSIGPCYVCPSGTKNSKIQNVTDVECELCSSDNYCPLAAVGDVPRDPYTLRISQAVIYPETSASDAYDDILMENMFRLQTGSIRCLITSPLFWSLIIFAIVLSIIIVAGLFRMFPKFMPHYLFITRIFKRTDLIGEGELWIGGLLSFCVFALVVFAAAFSATFIHLYPIETSSDSPLTCDSSIRNAKFSTSFHLLSLPVSEDEATIFDLLNKQSFTLLVDLLNTLITCPDVKITLKSGAHEIPFYDYNCTQTSAVIVSVSLPLPTHLITVDFNFSTSYSISGLRVCLSGSERIERDSYTARLLQTCEFFGGTNATLGHKPQVNFILTKVINKTEPLVIGDPILFSGLFIPTAIVEGISDELLYDLQGEYKRYLFTYTLLTIDLSETIFYILNRQDPIVREGEIIFHNIVFMIAVIELLGFTFLIFKLFIIPLVHRVTRRFFNKTRVEPIVEEIENNVPS